MNKNDQYVRLEEYFTQPLSWPLLRLQPSLLLSLAPASKIIIAHSNMLWLNWLSRRHRDTCTAYGIFSRINHSQKVDHLFLLPMTPKPLESSSSCWRWWILITASSSCIHRKYEPLKRRACRLKKINCLADSGWVLTEYGLCLYLEIGINCFHGGSQTYFLTQRSEPAVQQAQT